MEETDKNITSMTDNKMRERVCQVTLITPKKNEARSPATGSDPRERASWSRHQQRLKEKHVGRGNVRCINLQRGCAFLPPRVQEKLHGEDEAHAELKNE